MALRLFFKLFSKSLHFSSPLNLWGFFFSQHLITNNSFKCKQGEVHERAVWEDLSVLFLRDQKREIRERCFWLLSLYASPSLQAKQPCMSAWHRVGTGRHGALGETGLSHDPCGWMLCAVLGGSLWEWTHVMLSLTPLCTC